MFSRFVLFFLLGCSGLSHCLIETLKKVAGRFLLALPVDIKYVMRRVTGSTSEKIGRFDYKIDYRPFSREVLRF